MPEVPEGSDGEQAPDAALAAPGAVHSQSGTHKVFISYASADRAVADSVCTALERAGVTCWIAPRDVTPGELYSEAIVHAIDSATVAVLVLSQNATVSQHVLREVERASSKRRPLVSFRIDLAPIPAALEYFLNTSQWLDASATGVERALPKLVDAVQRCAAHASDPAPGHPGGAERPPARTEPEAALATKARQRPRLMLAALVAITAVALAYVVVDKFWLTKRVDEQQPMVEATPAISDKSIAVLPFADMSEKKDQDYFSDGISEELLNLLAQVPELKVIARTSSFSYKGKDIKVEQIGQELHVAHVLEGSVRKSGNTIRITAQLVRASDSRQLWSESFDRPFDDIFAVQDEIAGAVVEQLKIKLLGSVPKTRKADPEAYTLFLQAVQLDRQYTQAGLAQSIVLYQRALAIDPTYTAAWVGLAGDYAGQAFLGHGPRSADENVRLMRAALNKALAIDPDYALAHALLGWIAMRYDDDLPAAARFFEHAMALAPADPAVIAYAGEFALALGRLDTAIEVNEYVAAHDPVNPAGHDNWGDSNVRAGHLDESIARYRAALTLSAEGMHTHYGLGVALLLKGDKEAALSAMQAEPDEGWRLTGLAVVYHALGKKAESDAALAELIRKHEKSWSSSIAWVLAFRGETDAAFVWMDKAVANRDTGVMNFPTEPLLANLHNDPRWLPFLRKIGKAPEQLAAIRFEVKVPE